MPGDPAMRGIDVALWTSRSPRPASVADRGQAGEYAEARPCARRARRRSPREAALDAAAPLRHPSVSRADVGDGVVQLVDDVIRPDQIAQMVAHEVVQAATAPRGPG